MIKTQNLWYNHLSTRRDSWVENQRRGNPTAYEEDVAERVQELDRSAFHRRIHKIMIGANVSSHNPKKTPTAPVLLVSPAFAI